MSEQGRRFHPSELDLELDHESAELLATARDLEAYAAAGTTAPTAGFEDRVMAAIATEPMPRAAGRGFLATLRDAWAIALGPDRPMMMRAQALAMLLALALAVGSVGSVAVVGAMRLLGPDGTPPPTLPSPSPSIPPSPSVSPSPLPTETPTPSPRTPRPTETQTVEPSETDDHGGGGSGGSDDNSGRGSSGSSDDSSGRGSDGSGGSGGGSGDSSGKGSGTGSGSDDASESTDD